MLSKFDELKLIARCVAADDRNAFGLLVEEYQDGLRRFIFNLTLGDASLTDDLAQETFLKAYLSIRSFRGLSRFKTWLYRIAYNEYYSYMRKQREERIETIDIIPESTTQDHSSIEAGIDVATCLKSLNEKERSIIILFYLEDQPINKIAAITNVPVGSIKSYLSRARKKMATLFIEQ